MKRLLSILLAIVMVFSMLPVMAFATGNPTISFETDFNDGMQAGDSFTVTVNISGIEEIGIGTLTLSLDWNPDVLQFDGFARKTTGAKKLITDVLNSGNVVAVDAVDENGLGIPGKVVAADLDGYWDEGALFTAKFTIKAGGNLGLGLKSGDGDVFQIKNRNSEDVQTVIDTSAVEGKKAAGAGAGPKYEAEWPFSKITTSKGDAIAVTVVDEDEEPAHYHVVIPNGAQSANITFKRSLADFQRDMDLETYDETTISGATVCMNADEDKGMVSYEYADPTDQTTVVIIPMTVVDSWGMGGSYNLLGNPFSEAEQETYFKAAPLDNSPNPICFFTFEYGEAAGGEGESSHTHSYTATLAVPEAKVADATCQKGATYRKSCADETCGQIAPDEKQYYFYSGEPVSHNYVNHVCSYEGCTDPNEPKYAITATEGITVTSDAAGENAITNAFAGDTVYLHAVPPEGKTAVFTVGENTINGTSFTMPAEEVSVSVNYEDITYYNITVDSNVVGGTIKAYADDGHTEEITGAYEGQTVYLEPVPNAGYRHTGVIWYKTGDAPQTEAGNGAFIMPGAAVTVSTVFTANTYNITAKYDESLGSVTVNSSARTGDTVSLNIVPNENVSISAYSATYGEENTPFEIGSEFIMPAGDLTINVTFKKNNAIKRETFEIKHPSIVTHEDGTHTMTMKEGATRTLKSFMETVEKDLAPTQHIEYRSTHPDYVRVDPLTCEIKVLQYTEETVMIQAFVVDDSISWASDEPLREVALTIEEVSDGYTVSLEKDQEVFKLGEVTIPVTVGTSGENTPNNYHAYELILAYDSRYLELNEKILSGQASVSQVNVDGNMRTVAIRHYGNEKTVSADKINLPFIASEIGEAYVELKSAKVGLSEEALNDDASDAEVITTDIWVEVNGYKVTLGEGFIGLDVADPADDYVFTKNTSRINEALYDYEFEFKVDGKDVKVTGNGTDDEPYCISKKDINGEITIRIHKETEKKFEVTKEGDAADCLSFVSGVDFDSVNGKFLAQYNRKVEVKLTPAEGKVLQDYDAAVITIGGVTKEYLADNGIYTIPGTDITGEIEITVNEKSSAEPSEYNVTFTGRGCRHLAENTPHKAEAGKSYSFTVNHAEGFTYTVAATMNNTAADFTTVETKEAEKVVTTTYTITEVTGDLTINIDMTDRAVEVKNYLDLGNNSTMFLVKATETLFDKEILTYNGSQMYVKAENNQGKQEWRYLVIVSGQQAQTTGEEGGDSQTTESATLTTEAAAQKMAIRALTEQETVNTWTPTDNVNGSETLDINDAQLVYDMYNKKYSGFTEKATMTKFLNADVNTNDTIDTQDAQAVVNAIIAANNETRSQNTEN